MADGVFVRSDVWLGELLDRHGVEVERRGLQVRRELDADLPLRRTGAGDRALERLLRFAFATVPDDCEVFVASARPLSPVAALGEGDVTLRWQVVGPEAADPGETVAPIRPLPGGATAHARSAAAGELRAACAALGWPLELSPANRDREIWLRVRLR